MSFPPSGPQNPGDQTNPTPPSPDSPDATAQMPPAPPYAAQPAQPYAQPAQPYAQPGQPYAAQPTQPYAQPGQPYAQPGQPSQTAPYGVQPPYGTPGTPYPGQMPMQAPKKKRVGLIVGIIIVVLVLIGAAVTALLLLLGGGRGGSPTAEASIKKVSAAFEKNRFDDIAREFSPKEMDYFNQFMDGPGGESPQTAKNANKDMHDGFVQMQQSLKFTMDDVEYDTVKLNDTMTAFNYTGGTLAAKVTDKEKFLDGVEKVLSTYADVYNEYFDTVPEGITDYDRYYGRINRINSSYVDQTIEELRRDLDNEDTQEIELGNSRGGATFSVVSVKEGDSWYVSPLLSFYNTSIIQHEDIQSVDLPAPAKYVSAEKAGEGFMEAIENRDVTQMEAALPEVERRVVALLMSDGNDPYDMERLKRKYDVEIDGVKFRPLKGIGRTTSLIFEKMNISLQWDEEHYSYWDEEDTTVRNNLDMKLTDGTMRIEAAQDGDTKSTCKIDMSPLQSDKLPLFGISAVQENDGWHISLLSTLLNWSANAYTGENLDTIDKWSEDAQDSCKDTY